MFIAYRFRLKDKNTAVLDRMAGSVNFVWNYCNQASFEYLSKKGNWLSAFDLNNLTVGCSKSLGLPSEAIDVVCAQHAMKRRQFRKARLSWRSRKRSLGWIPFKNRTFRVEGDDISFYGHRFKFWKSRDIAGIIRCGSFNQDSKGHWFVNIQCKIDANTSRRRLTSVGIDLGLKSLMTTSDGHTFEGGKYYKSLEPRLALAQRARKKKLARNINQKIANQRKDELHKLTTNLARNYDTIFVGDVSPSKLSKTRMAKPVKDSGWSMLKSMLAYKAIRLGVEYKEINEMFSTVTCSSCFQKTGPSGLRALGVREWICSCGASHNRDVNAAKNILRFGHESLINGAARAEMPKSTPTV